MKGSYFFIIIFISLSFYSKSNTLNPFSGNQQSRKEGSIIQDTKDSETTPNSYCEELKNKQVKGRSAFLNDMKTMCFSFNMNLNETLKNLQNIDQIKVINNNLLRISLIKMRINIVKNNNNIFENEDVKTFYNIDKNRVFICIRPFVYKILESSDSYNVQFYCDKNPNNFTSFSIDNNLKQLVPINENKKFMNPPQINQLENRCVDLINNKELKYKLLNFGDQDSLDLIDKTKLRVDRKYQIQLEAIKKENEDIILELKSSLYSKKFIGNYDDNKITWDIELDSRFFYLSNINKTDIGEIKNSIASESENLIVQKKIEDRLHDFDLVISCKDNLKNPLIEKKLTFFKSNDVECKKIDPIDNIIINYNNKIVDYNGHYNNLGNQQNETILVLGDFLNTDGQINDNLATLLFDNDLISQKTIKPVPINDYVLQISKNIGFRKKEFISSFDNLFQINDNILLLNYSFKNLGMEHNGSYQLGLICKKDLKDIASFQFHYFPMFEDKNPHRMFFDKVNNNEIQLKLLKDEDPHNVFTIEDRGDKFIIKYDKSKFEDLYIPKPNLSLKFVTKNESIYNYFMSFMTKFESKKYISINTKFKNLDDAKHIHDSHVHLLSLSSSYQSIEGGNKTYTISSTPIDLGRIIKKSEAGQNVFEIAKMLDKKREANDTHSKFDLLLLNKQIVVEQMK